MKKRVILFLLVQVYSQFAFAQDYKRNNVWSIGSEPVLKFNFTNGLQIDTVENYNQPVPVGCIINSCSSISDTTGKLLFFSNGYILYDSSGYALDNGLYVNCPYGNVLANYYGGKSIFDQTSIILPKKGNTYYVFSTGMSDSFANLYLIGLGPGFDVLNYSVVDMDSNAGLGKVIAKNVVLADNQHFTNTALHAVKHSNGKDWWLVKADCYNNRYQEFLVREDTILGPFYHQATDLLGNAFCIGGLNQIYFNKQGTQMVSGIYGTLKNGSFYDFNRTDIYDFDRCNGKLTFRKYYEVPYDTSTFSNNDYKQGLCFSPNGKLLYMSTIYNIYQIDLEDTNTNNAILIHSIDTTISQFPWYGLMNIAPDNRLYIGNGNATRKYMSYIDSPNVRGLGCHFIPQGLWQPYTNLRSPPNMPNYGLAADTSVICWPLGTTEINEVRNEILVYPNPSNSFLILESNVLVNKENTILLYDVLGQLVLKKTIFSSTNKIQLDIHSLSNGLYTLRIDKFAKKIIKD